VRELRYVQSKSPTVHKQRDCKRQTHENVWQELGSSPSGTKRDLDPTSARVSDPLDGQKGKIKKTFSTLAGLEPTPPKGIDF
jgi:hypothetical protein